MVHPHSDGHRGGLLGQDGDLEIDPMLAIGAGLGARQAGSPKDGYQAAGHNAEERPSPHTRNPIGNATIPAQIIELNP
jgi:hypothetical protein